MKRKIRHYLIPHKKNGYVPWLLSKSSVVVLFVIIVALFGFFFAASTIFVKNSNTAEIYSSVLENLASQDRMQANIPVLTVNPLLEQAAQAKANDMLAKGYFAHYAPDGTSPWYWIVQSGYQFSFAGENLAIDFSDSNDVNNAWLNSPTHRENIMNIHYTEIGVAVARGMYQGRETTFVVQMFGSPVLGPTMTESSSPNIAGTTVISNPTDSTHSPQAAVTKLISEPKVTALITSKTPDKPIAVKNASIKSTAIPTTTQKVLGAESPTTPQPSPIAATISNPRQTISYAYVIIAALIIISLIGVIVVGFKRKDHKLQHVLYGIGLLILMYAFIQFTIIHFGMVIVV